MEFRSASSDQENDSFDSVSGEYQQSVPDRSQSTDSAHGGMTASQAEQQFDVDIESRRELNELQRLEQTHGEKVHEWVEEGMPREVMGSPRNMRAFRKQKGTPVPWNIETQNAQSVQRSTEAAAETGPAGETSVPDSVREVISSSGHSLDGSIQRMMETEMGESFDNVQVHTGVSAANACESINARAFTVGNHVAFNAGEYDPSSAEGQHVIAHELAHVRQQTGGAVSMLPQKGVELEIDPDPQLEREAEATAQRVMAGKQLGIQRLGKTEVHIQRMDPDQPLHQNGSEEMSEDEMMTDQEMSESDVLTEQESVNSEVVSDETTATEDLLALQQELSEVNQEIREEIENQLTVLQNQMNTEDVSRNQFAARAAQMALRRNPVQPYRRSDMRRLEAHYRYLELTELLEDQEAKFEQITTDLVEIEDQFDLEYSWGAVPDPPEQVLPRIQHTQRVLADNRRLLERLRAEQQ